MPKASEHVARSIHKRLLLGDSGTGKTTALAALTKAGFQLRIWDYDNLLDPLFLKVKWDCPDKLDTIEYMSFRDRLKSTVNGPIIDGLPKAFVAGLSAFYKWEDGSVPYEWGSNHIVVIDSFTTMCRAAYFWARGLAGAGGIPEGVSTKGVDTRNVYHTAQQAIMNVISMLTADDFRANVLVIAHVKYLEHDGQSKGYPLAVGTAISPEIPSWFSSVTLATTSGTGDNIRRVLRTRSTNMINLKDPKAFDPSFATELPMEDGLVTLFK